MDILAQAHCQKEKSEKSEKSKIKFQPKISHREAQYIKKKDKAINCTDTRVAYWIGTHSGFRSGEAEMPEFHLRHPDWARGRHLPSSGASRVLTFTVLYTNYPKQVRKSGPHKAKKKGIICLCVVFARDLIFVWFHPRLGEVPRNISDPLWTYHDATGIDSSVGGLVIIGGSRSYRNAHQGLEWCKCWVMVTVGG